MDNGPERRSSKAFITWDVSSAPDGAETPESPAGQFTSCESTGSLMIFFVFLHCYGFFFLGGGGKSGKIPCFYLIIGSWDNPIPASGIMGPTIPFPACFQNAQKFVPCKAIRPPSLGEFCCLGNFDSNSGFLPLNRNIQDRKDSNPRGVLFYFPLRDTHL